MIFVIVPLGKAASDVLNWFVRVLVYVAASTLGGALGGALAAALGALIYLVVPGPTRAWPVVIVGGLALLYGLHEAHLLRLPQPERAWQVPNAWLMRWSLLGPALFGLVIGSGLFTFIPFTSFYTLLAWEAATGSVLLGAALGATYGLVRGLPAVSGGVIMLAGKHPLGFNMWILEHRETWHRLTGAVLLGVAGFLFMVLIKM